MDGSVIAAWAGAAASLIGAGLTVWWPWHNRPQADWTFVEHEADIGQPISSTIPGFTDLLEEREETEPDFIISLYNSGDGDAYDVKMTGIGCEAHFLTFEDVGKSRSIACTDVIAQFKTSEHVYLIIRTENDAPLIAIRLHWTKQPTRLRSRVFQTYTVRGQYPDQPKQPIPEKKQHFPSMLRYRFEHSRFGLWLYSKFPRWAWRTLVPRPASPTKQEEPSQESPHQ